MGRWVPMSDGDHGPREQYYLDGSDYPHGMYYSLSNGRRMGLYLDKSICTVASLEEVKQAVEKAAVNGHPVKRIGGGDEWDRYSYRGHEFEDIGVGQSGIYLGSARVCHTMEEMIQRIDAQDDCPTPATLKYNDWLVVIEVLKDAGQLDLSIELAREVAKNLGSVRR